MRNVCAKWICMVAVGAALATVVEGQFAPKPAPVTALGGEAPATQRWTWRDRTLGVALELSPAAEGKPAMRYALLPRAEEREYGNAAVKYLQAAADGGVEMHSADMERMRQVLDEAISNAPLAALDPKDPDVVRMGELFRTSKSLGEGARMDGVDWETNLRKYGFEALLPSLGKYREQARILKLEIRMAIRRHDWGMAREKICTGMALARHLGEGETLIESLVGVAIAQLTLQTLEDWVAEPGSPNLYWALTGLPAPFNDLRKAMDFERCGLWFSIPEVKEVRAGRIGSDQVERMMRGLLKITNQVSGGGGPSLQAMEPEWKAKAAAAGMAAAMYPEAKKYLASRGMTAEVVEKLSVNEAVCRYFVESYDEEADEMFKWMGVPGVEGFQGMQAWERGFNERRAKGQVNMMASIALPALSNARATSLRLDRQIAALRVIEAIRMHAAANGKLPSKLEELTVPVPADPTTGAPFRYRAEGGNAFLESPGEPKRNMMKYELTLRP